LARKVALAGAQQEVQKAQQEAGAEEEEEEEVQNVVGRVDFVEAADVAKVVGAEKVVVGSPLRDYYSNFDSLCAPK
jgi:nucleotide-binding universal stress UspA family protein